MLDYIVRRLMLALITVALVLVATFTIIRLLPGDVVTLMAHQNNYAADEHVLRHQLKLDQPIYEQFGRWVGGAVHGDFGRSLWTKQTVASELKRRFPITAELGLLSVLFGVILAVPVGILSAIRQDSAADYIARTLAVAFISLPSFWVATLILTFPLLWWKWSPPLTYAGWAHPIDHLTFYIAPAICLATTLAGGVMRLTRTSMLDVVRQDYIRTAWSKGMRERTVMIRHAMKNAMIPVITVVGLQVALVFGGTVIIESIFQVPGVGRFFYDAVINRDYPALQGVIFFIAVIIVSANLLVDLAYGYLDPRIRYS
ncbi:MAG: ABC transporter permease [Dehalococcoidia bacterium]